MTGFDRWSHTDPPDGHGLWTATLHVDSHFTSDRPLSPEAAAVRDAGLSFPKFGAPGRDALKFVVAERFRKSGSKSRPYGRDKIGSALKELEETGYYAVRQETAGRKAGNKSPLWATIRSYSNKPWEHVKELNALPIDEVWWHFRRMEASTKHLALPVKAPKRRLSRAG